MGFTKHHLRELSPHATISVLGTYLFDCKLGNNKKKLKDLTATTLSNYLVAAHSYLEVLQGRHIDIMDASFGGKARRYHPYLANQLSERRKWTKPRLKKEPLTTEMFQALAKLLANTSDKETAFLSQAYCVYDWFRLGVFTGFRIGEYGQSNLRGRLFNTVPFKACVPEHLRGTPLAFIAADFTFYDRNHILIRHEHLLSRHHKGDVYELEICWRYDKGAENFAIRRFRATGDAIFDPVAAAVSIIHRTQVLKVPTNNPIGVWSNDGGSSHRFLKDTEVKKVLHLACELAYPDPNHYMRLHKAQIVPHSNRVTAAVCLQKGGASNDEIAFKLRWHPTSVPTYLRDCFQGLGSLLEKTVQGVLNMTL